MKNIFILTLAGLCCMGIMTPARADTAEDFERAGIAQFKKAFYEALPREDTEAAAEAFARAEKAFAEAIRLEPKRIEPYLYLGRTLFVQEKYPAAVKRYRQALGLDPGRPEISLQLASAQEMAGDDAGAVETLKAMRLKEKDPRAVQILDGFIEKIEKRAAEKKGRAAGEEGRHD
jgi:tetratricopeptide (TPR) repeat protein